MTRMSDKICVHVVLMGKTEGRRPIGRSLLRSEDNGKMYLQEIGWRRVDLIYLVQDSDAWQAVLHVNGF